MDARLQRHIMEILGSSMSDTVRFMKGAHMRKIQFKTSSLLLSGFFACGLGACSHVPDGDSFGMGEPPPNYQSRHPIELTGSTESTNIDVSIAGAQPSAMQLQKAESFGRAFQSDGEGVLSIGIPVGAVNERQAANAAKDVRDRLVSQNIPAHAVVYRPYKSGPGAAAPPLILSYHRIKAQVPNSCGVIDNLDITWRNTQSQDFGCSTQNNFAAMLANPDDLERPRPLDNPNATRRSAVLEKYATSGNPALTGGQATGGSK